MQCAGPSFYSGFVKKSNNLLQISIENCLNTVAFKNMQQVSANKGYQKKLTPHAQKQRMRSRVNDLSLPTNETRFVTNKALLHELKL